MVSSIRENCGIALAHSLEDAYELAKHQNHRGQDTAGIGYMNHQNGIYTVRWIGKVSSFDITDLKGLFGQFSEGDDSGMFVSHVKYTTVGSKDPRAILDASHPHHVGNVQNYDRGSHLITKVPKKVLAHNAQFIY